MLSMEQICVCTFWEKLGKMMTTFDEELHITSVTIIGKGENIVKTKMHLLICNGPVTEKGVTKMRENIIERILALTDEQVQELITLLQQSEEEDSTSPIPHQTSA